jgi:DNA-binding response OmpR family regulator
MKHNVLLVDDDGNLLTSLARVLHRQPFTVLTAQSGEEAMTLLRTRRIDVIVADERMPGISGIELLSWVANNYPGVARIVLTGYAEADMAIRAINDASVACFFTKPCNEARLAIAIRTILERKASLADGRQTLDACRRQLMDLHRLSQDANFRARILSHDLQPPIDRILECCRRLEVESAASLDRESLVLLAEARLAAAEARELVMQLQRTTASRTPRSTTGAAATE